MITVRSLPLRCRSQRYPTCAGSAYFGTGVRSPCSHDALGSGRRIYCGRYVTSSDPGLSAIANSHPPINLAPSTLSFFPLSTHVSS